VLRLVALGKSSCEIADELFISIETVNTHRKLIKQKLGISYAHAFDVI
jgi:DNA-binding CsgD family transcriptional regulator